MGEVRSGSFTTNAYAGVRSIKFNWWLISQSIEDNTSKIGYEFVGSGSNKGDWYYVLNGYLNINGSRKYTQNSTKIQLDVGTKLASGEMTIKHNEDGKKSFSANGGGTIYNYGTYQTGSGSWELPQIARASTPSVTGTLQLGNTLTINTNRASNSFIHNLYYSWGSEIQNERFATGIGASTTFTIPKDLANYIPNGASGTLFITCETYQQNNDELTLIGTKTINVTIEVPDIAEFKPKISNIALSEAVSGIFNKFGIYIQNQSKVSGSITASGAYSSTIKSYKVVVNGTTYNEKTFTTDFLKLAGTNTVSVTVTDSRGKTATSIKEFEVAAYDGPVITKFTANRCFENGTLDDEGEFAKLDIIATIPSLNNKNSYSYELQYRDTDEDQYTQYEIELSEEKTSTEITISGSFIIPADGDNEIDYMITVTDYFLPVNKVKGIDTVFQLMNFNASGKGMSIGKISEKDAFEIGMDMYDKFDTLITNGLAEYEYGTIDADTTLSHLCLAQYNTPNNSFYYVMTFFYGTKSLETNRTQMAIPYIFDASQNKKNIWVRQYVNGSWNEWTEVAREIVESGSNANGSYIKYSDGTMIINQTVKGSINISKAWGSLYVSDDIKLPDFPVPFIEDPTTVVSPQTQSGTQFMLVGSGGSGNGDETFGGHYALVRPNSRTGVAYILEVIAKGKWK